jgi:hypothetical protein
VSPSGLKSGGAKRFGECAFGLFFVGWVKRTLSRNLPPSKENRLTTF